MKNKELERQVKKLRTQGKMYSEINRLLGVSLPKSTLSYWCRGIRTPASYQDKLEAFKRQNLAKCRQIALESVKQKKREKNDRIVNKYSFLSPRLGDTDASLIVLATLYLGEGTKGDRGCLTFGNSSPGIISLFMRLLRQCFKIDESKFRCTVQGRSDMNIHKAELFWSNSTNIPIKQFYPARIDPRTAGKKTIKSNYQGVCRIDYLSVDIFRELVIIGDIIMKYKN